MIQKLYKAIVCLLLFLLGLFVSADAQDSDRAYRVDTFRTGDSPSVAISTSGGSINAIGGNGSEVRVEMYVRKRGRYLDPSDTDLSDFEIRIESNGNDVVAEAKRKGSGWNFFNSDRNLSISFVVYTPSGASVSANTSGGSVSARSLNNRVSLRTSGGSVNVSDMSGEIDMRTSGGSLNIENVNGTLNGTTSGGSINVANLSGIADLRTSGGSIRLDRVSAKVSANTSGGGISGDFLTFDEDIELRTSGGSIRVQLPFVVDFDLDLRGMRVNTELRNFTGEFERNRVKGRIGNGGPMLTARTSGGSVSVEYE